MIDQMPLHEGARLGPYAVLGQIGAGGMGEVYRARDTRLGREVAVKVLQGRLAADPESLDRFGREARAVAALSHPNILAIHDFGTEGDIAYAVTELLQGETLRARLEKETLAWRKAVEIGAAVVEGLASAHANGIVHRDLKPENIFLTSDGQTKILDFGLVRLEPHVTAADATSAQTAGLTEPGAVLGTPSYMSPEQVRGLPVDARTDIFSFGSVLYEMVTGGKAFRGRASADVLSSVLRDQPPDAVDSGRGIPIALARLITRCLEKSPNERFQSARDLTFALREIAAAPSMASSTTVSASAATLAAPAGRRPRATAAGVAVACAAVLVVLAFVLDLGGLRQRITGAAPSIRSLAVLPLRDLSSETQESFADGMTEELISNLARFGAIQITSRTSAMSYKGTKKRIPEIARELNVDAIVEGSVTRSAGRVHVTAQLIDAASDKNLWAETYDRELGDVLALESELAQGIARAIRLQLSPHEEARFAKEAVGRRVDPAAHDAYMRGRYFWNKRDKEGFARALVEFQAATDADPLYAAAYAGLADTYNQLGYNNLQAPGDAFPKAKAAATKALELDPGLAEAHASIGYVKMYYDWDFAGAERDFQEAIRLSPNYAPAHQWYAYLSTCLERPMGESVGHAETARRLDPLSPSSYTDLAFVLFYYGKLDEALENVNAALALDPKFPLSYFWLARIYTNEKRFADAQAALEKTEFLSTWTPTMAARGILDAAWNRPEEARKVLAEFAAMGRAGKYVSPYATAGIHAWLGEKDEALLLLEAAYRERTHWMLWLRRDPRWNPLRDDPRFKDLTKRVGLPS